MGQKIFIEIIFLEMKDIEKWEGFTPIPWHWHSCWQSVLAKGFGGGSDSVCRLSYGLYSGVGL